MQNPNHGIRPGTKLCITVTEPWEVVTDLRSSSLMGCALRATPSSAVVVRLEEPISRAGEDYMNLLASPRRLGDNFMQDSGSVFCALVSISDAEAEQSTLIKLTDFSGRLMLMGDVSW
jgi:hypothetical protein